MAVKKTPSRKKPVVLPTTRKNHASIRKRPPLNPKSTHRLKKGNAPPPEILTKAPPRKPSVKPLPTAIQENPFRVTGIPANATVADLKSRLLTSEVCTPDEIATIRIVEMTLCPSCYGPITQTALIRFSQAPSYLQGVNQYQLQWDHWTLTIDQSFVGLTQLYRTPPGVKIEADIIAVPGIDGHPYGSWRQKGQPQKMWLRDFFRDQFPNCRTMIYGYETRPENPGNELQSNPDDEINGIKRLDHYASGLLSAMAKARCKGEAPRRPIIFIGHSLGGVIITMAIVKSRDDTSLCPGIRSLVLWTRATIFFATPHRGFEVENIPAMLPEGSLGIPLLKSIQKQGHLLAENCQRFIDEATKQKFMVLTYCEKQNKNRESSEDEGGKRQKLDEKYVPVSQSAVCLGINKDFEKRVRSRRNHLEIATFHSAIDQRYLKLRDCLSERLSEAPNIHDFETMECAIQHENTIAAAQILSEQPRGTPRLRDKLPDRLTSASTNGNTEMAILPLGTSVDTNDVDIARSSALPIAACQGFENSARVFLNAGAEIEDVRGDEYTPLHLAALGGYGRVAKVLLEKGANTETRALSCRMALHLAADEDMAKILLQWRANIESKSHCRKTPLYTTARIGDLSVPKALLDAGANRNLKLKDKETLPHFAANGGDEGIAGAVLGVGVDMTMMPRIGTVTLHVAACEGHCGAVRALLDVGGATPDISRSREIVLYYAAMEGQAGVVGALLDAGTNEPSIKELEAMRLAVLGRHENVIETLFNYVDGGVDADSRRAMLVAIVAKFRNWGSPAPGGGSL